MDVCLMVEGQEDVTWEGLAGRDWLALAAACEEHGVGTMFCSDHYLSVDDRRERGSLEEAIEQLRELEGAGLTRLMGQHLLHRDLDADALMGQLGSAVP
jgi:hypothetical protein